jgi:dihydrodipicolinate synthase/N-acetylneuraminate lyase
MTQTRIAKDSSGNLAYARELAQIAGFRDFPSSETALADAGRDGYAGCISATVNIDPRGKCRASRPCRQLAANDRRQSPHSGSQIPRRQTRR